MTQEILDYLLIRSFLINYDGEDLIRKVEEPNDFINIINSIARLMEEEDYLLLSSEFWNRVSIFVSQFRFDFNRDKKVNDDMNYIIGRLSDYKNMSLKRKIYLSTVWEKQEAKDRRLPFKYGGMENLLKLIALDEDYIIGMVNYDTPFVVQNVIEYLSLVNLLISKFPCCFDDFNFYYASCQNINCLNNIPKLPFDYKMYINKTLNRLKKLEKNIEDDKECIQENKIKKIGKRF